MNVLILQIFISLILVAGSVVLFIHTVRSRTLEHTDRLALAPLEDDGADVDGSAGDTTRNTGGDTGAPTNQGDTP